MRQFIVIAILIAGTQAYGGGGGSSGSGNSYQAGQPSYGGSYQPPAQSYQPPPPSYSPPVYNPPPPPAPVYQPPPPPAYQPPAYQPPAYQPPAQSYSPPMPPAQSYSPPAQSYSPPAQSYGGGSQSYGGGSSGSGQGVSYGGGYGGPPPQKIFNAGKTAGIKMTLVGTVLSWLLINTLLGIGKRDVDMTMMSQPIHNRLMHKWRQLPASEMQHVLDFISDNDDGMCIPKMVCELNAKQDRSSFGLTENFLINFFGASESLAKPGNVALVYKQAAKLGNTLGSGESCKATYSKCTIETQDIIQLINLISRLR